MFRTCSVLVVMLGLVYGYPDEMTQYRAHLLNGEIMVVNETNRFQNIHPNKKYVGMSKVKLVKGQINYTIGKRITGDELVAEKTDKQNFPSAKDVQIILKYPTSGKGKILTHVNIVVDQSSNIGDGYVIEGGIEQRNIQILIEANETLRFSYSASFYGY